MEKLNINENDSSSDDGEGLGKDDDDVSIASQKSRVSSIGKSSKNITKKKTITGIFSTTSVHSNTSKSPDHKALSPVA